MDWQQTGQLIGVGAVGLLTGLAPQIMLLRRRASKDRVERIRDDVEESHLDGLRADRLIAERDKWEQRAFETRQQLSEALAQVERYKALQENHEALMKLADRQIDRLWKLVLKFAPEGPMKEALEAEFARSTTPGDLESTPGIERRRKP